MYAAKASTGPCFTQCPFNLDLKNRVAQFLVTAFVSERLTSTWPDAMKELLGSLASSILGRQIMLKFCALLTDEIATQGPRIRSESELQRNAQIRDAMRASGENAGLCAFWREVMAEGEHTSQATSELVVEALNCLASYSSWIDVSLVVEGDTLRLLYQHLQSPNPQIQIAGASCLGQIILKGMPARDKIGLANYLNLESVFGAVVSRGIVDGFFAQVTGILSNLGCSLSASPLEAVSNDERDIISGYVGDQLLPHVLSFAGLIAVHDSEAAFAALQNLIPIITTALMESRAQKDDLRPSYRIFVTSLLPVVLRLLPRYLEAVEEEEMETSEAFDDEEGKVLVALLQTFDSIAWIMSRVAISALMDILTSQPSLIPLGCVELLASLALRLPEALKGCPSFVIKINGESRLTPMAELIVKLSTLPLARNDLGPRQWSLIARLIARYSSTALFDSFPEQIEPSLRVLYRWLELGAWSKAAAAELLLRVCRNLKGKLALHAVELLGAMQGPMSSDLVRTPALYEICGLAVAVLDSSSISLADATRSLLTSAIDRLALLKDEDVALGLDFIGSFARGFAAETCASPEAVQRVFAELVLPAVGGVLSRKSSAVMISAISAIQRLVPLCQSDSVVLVQASVYACCQAPLVGDAAVLECLLPLIAASLFKLRDSFARPEVFGSLWPELHRSCLMALARTPQGTDDWVHLSGLIRALLALLIAIVNAPATAGFSVWAGPQGGLDPLADRIIAAMMLPDSFALLPEASGLARTFVSLVGKVSNRLSRSLVADCLLPGIFTALLPASLAPYTLSSTQTHQTEGAMRKQLASIPAIQHQLGHEAASLLRGLACNQPELLTATRLPTPFLQANEALLTGRGDLKELKNALIIFYL
jgi:hypothetical protein